VSSPNLQLVSLYRMEVSVFLKKLFKLKVDRSKGAPAPHKAVLLLSVLQLMEYGKIKENRIQITPELVARFKDNWHSYVQSEKFNPNFTLPFYHLKSDGFWNLKTLPGRDLLLTSSNSIKSFQALKNAVAFAYFEDGIYKYLTDKHNNELAQQTLLETYLGGTRVTTPYNFLTEVAGQMLNEPPSAYKKEIEAADEEELFVRGGVFKKLIPKIYNYTCCISGLNITSTREVQMIDACHIVPFAESHDDTISNGLSLSPNFHRAFDRFLITIGDEYEVLVSDDFTESGDHLIRAFHGKRIQLPTETRYHPSLENLKWHRERFMRLH
jgi:putative restriction endonuclease